MFEDEFARIPRAQKRDGKGPARATESEKER